MLKIPDGSFSRGIVKVENVERLKAAADDLFQHTALVLAQEFMFTEFDWRIGVLNREPLYACKYFMSRGHWQIYNHARQRHREIRRLRDAAGARGAGGRGQAGAARDRGDRRRALRRRPEAVERPARRKAHRRSAAVARSASLTT